jgi:glycosyltransferase involved in cell wall biosynthesis
LDSIVKQNCKFQFEVIVADDCSNDGTREIIEEFAIKYPGVVKPILRHENVGVTRNYIELHSSATGEYVAHSDGDDYWYPGKLQYQVELMDANPHYSQSWCCADVVDDKARKLRIFPSRLARFFYPVKLSAADVALSYGLVGQHSTQIYRRRCQPKFNFNEPILDYWIAFQLALSGEGFYSKKIFSAYRVASTGSLTHNVSPKKYSVDALALALVRVVKQFPEHQSEAKANAIVRYWFSRIKGHDLRVAEQCLQQMDGVKTRLLLIVRSAFYFALQKLP